ncbi:MAG: hypothetical protein IT303_14965 [Dehalococcoidia bacterium]|nr:hypothetical protein [Dehalococcoidia bacterium]
MPRDPGSTYETSASTGDLHGAIGVPIYTADGRFLGTIKEVRDAYFKVDVAYAPDYWLSQDEVALHAGSQVVLYSNHDDIDARKHDEPGPGTTGDDSPAHQA